MKTETLFASIFLSLLTCLPVALAAPTPVGYKVLPEPPPPGHSGVHHDKEKKVVHVYYGDKDMKEHMEHQMYNVRKHPENNRVFRPGKPGNNKNRLNAMGSTETLPSFARDEKPPNSAAHNRKTTTMRYLPLEESNRERNLLGTTTRRARDARAGMRYHANPGPNYHGRGDRSLSIQSAPGVRTGTSSRPPWNAGRGLKRSDSAEPYPKWRAPEPKTTTKLEKLEDDTPTRGRSSRPAGPSRGGKGKERAREPSSSSSESRSRSSSRDHSPEPPKSRLPTPDTKGKGKGPAAPSKPAWGAGPGAQEPARRSGRIAASRAAEQAAQPSALPPKPETHKT